MKVKRMFTRKFERFKILFNQIIQKHNNLR